MILTGRIGTGATDAADTIVLQIADVAIALALTHRRDDVMRLIA